MNEKIRTIREKIATIDREVFQLLIDRLEAVTAIGEVKKQEGSVSYTHLRAHED